MMNRQRALRKSALLRLTTCCLLLVVAARAQQPQTQATASAAQEVEKGKFRLHKFEQAIGEETYSIQRDGSSLVMTSNFEFKDRFTAVPLSATLKLNSDLTAQQFDIKGKNSRLTEVDDSVAIEGDTVHIRQSTTKKDEAKPKLFFLIDGYAPTAMQMMLMRYWLANGSPAKLQTFPAGTVGIEHRGQDQVESQGKTMLLERYSISGLIWGRETLWLDEQKQLFAVVTVDAEFDHFEAIREGNETVLGKLVAVAGQDEMNALAEMGRKLSGRRTGKLALVGGTLVDGTGRAAIPDAVVVIDGDQIVAAGPRAAVSIPKDATVVDTHGKTILPGLWDMHAHFEQVEWGAIYLAAGATTVRDCGNELEFITAVRDAIRDGRGLGPRLLLAGVVDGKGPAAIGLERVDNASDAQYWVNRYHDAGFQQMKIYSSMKAENVAAVAADAHRRGMTVTGHVPEGMNIFQAVDAGMDQINHIQYVVNVMIPESDHLPERPTRDQRMAAITAINIESPEAKKAVDFLKEHKTVIDPTMALMEMFTASPSHPFTSFEPGAAKVAPELAEQYMTREGPPDPKDALKKAVRDKELQVIGALHRAGVPIVVGTDQAVPGHSLHREIELYVEAGFTAMEAIQAATIVPARVMGLDKQVGTVEAGKKADVIVLGANPLEKISNIRTVEQVVTGGTLYDTAPLWESVGFKP
jgi:imidazolonepropionase-like amidohydrolase